MEKPIGNYELCLQIFWRLINKAFPDPQFKFDLKEIHKCPEGEPTEVCVSMQKFLKLLAWVIDQTAQNTVPIMIEFCGKEANHIALAFETFTGRKVRSQLSDLNDAGLSDIPRFDCGWKDGPDKCYWTIVGCIGDGKPRKKIIVYSEDDAKAVSLGWITDLQIPSKTSIP